MPAVQPSRTLLSPHCTGATIPSGSVLQSAMISVLVTGCIALVLGPYLSAVLPGSGENAGIPQHPLLCLACWRKRRRGGPLLER